MLAGKLTESIDSSCTVSLDLCTCPRAIAHWFLPVGRICLLGDLWRQVPDLSNTAEAGTPDAGLDSRHYIHFRCQFLLGLDVLAHRVFQCLRT